MCFKQTAQQQENLTPELMANSGNELRSHCLTPGVNSEENQKHLEIAGRNQLFVLTGLSGLIFNFRRPARLIQSCWSELIPAWWPKLPAQYNIVHILAYKALLKTTRISQSYEDNCWLNLQLSWLFALSHLCCCSYIAPGCSYVAPVSLFVVKPCCSPMLFIMLIPLLLSLLLFLSHCLLYYLLIVGL